MVYTLHQQLQVSGILQPGHGGTQQEKAIHSRPLGPVMRGFHGFPGCGLFGLAWRFGIDGVPDPKEIDRPVILAALSCLHRNGYLRNWQVQVNLKVMCVCVLRMTGWQSPVICVGFRTIGEDLGWFYRSNLDLLDLKETQHLMRSESS